MAQLPTHATRQSSRREDAKNLAGSALSSLAGALVHSRVGIVALVLVALALFGGLFDLVANHGRAYSGIMVGGIEVGGLNATQIEEKFSNEYASRLSAAEFTVYANESARDNKVVAEEYGDEVSVEQERENRVSWTSNADELQARIDYEKLAEQAVGYGKGNPSERFGLFFSTIDLPVPVNFNDAAVDALAHQIDLSIGKPLVNFDVVVENGAASVVEGEDGDMIDRELFKEQITEQLTSSDLDNRSFVAQTVYTPVQIDRQQAESVAQRINNALTAGISFVCGNESWDANAFDVSPWVETSVERDNDGSYLLSPHVSALALRTAVLEHIQPVFADGLGHVRFETEQDQVTVKVTSKGTFPLVGDAIAEIDACLFGEGAEGKKHVSYENGGLIVRLDSAEIPESMSLDQALDYGVVTPVSEFTTEYTTGASARNVNIHLAADLINDSVVAADGGEWSFNDTAGECNEEKGFQAATAIAADTTIDEIGGGICQVATTVFNAVYLGGYPILERYNHSLYVPSYPQGRDAAISWPKPDFRWQNDGSSDLLLRMTYTDSTVTATLYGVSEGYNVESEEGEWIEGAEFTTVYEYDDTLPEGYEYVKTTGTNGHSITVTRTVLDEEGTTLRQDSFLSVYNAQNTVVVRGSAGSSASAGISASTGWQ